MPVYKIRNEMPVSEFIGWINYFRKAAEGPEPLDLTAMSPDDMKRMFG